MRTIEATASPDAVYQTTFRQSPVMMALPAWIASPTGFAGGSHDLQQLVISIRAMLTVEVTMRTHRIGMVLVFVGCTRTPVASNPPPDEQPPEPPDVPVDGD